MEKIMKFDIHIHTDMSGGREIPRFDGEKLATPEELRVMYKKLGIDRGVLLPEFAPEAVLHFKQVSKHMIRLKNIPIYSFGSATLTRVWRETVLKPTFPISLSIIKTLGQKESENYSQTFPPTAS